MNVKICSSCGSSFLPSSNFCGQCGQKLQDETTLQPVSGKEVLSRLGTFLSDPSLGDSIREKLKGTTRYGTDLADPSIAIRTNPDETKTFGRFDERSGEFIPFSPEEQEVYGKVERQEHERPVTPFIPTIVKK